MHPLDTLAGNDTIAALSTAPGLGAIAVIRITGPDAISIADTIFKPKGRKDLSEAPSHTAVFGEIRDGEEIIDEVLCLVLKGSRSFTGEDTVEISCHGSLYIQSRILQVLLKNGARQARPGEFSMRAFRNGKMDLSQAEAVADLIASQSQAAHKIAMQQMRGGFSREINHLREQLIHFASLIELELDFSEEDVEFADRQDLLDLVNKIQITTNKLVGSFKTGNALKNGIPVVIAGEPNAGKSTLLNSLLNEEKAIVSEIPGTTRDAIEDVLSINGVAFRFIDTAGLRQTSDKIESIGISRTIEKMRSAEIILYLFDAANKSQKDVEEDLLEIREDKILGTKRIIPVANKIDKDPTVKDRYDISSLIFISGKEHKGLEELKDMLYTESRISDLGSDIIVSNVRHYEALLKVAESLDAVVEAIKNNTTGDLLAIDIRRALHYLGEITGQITTDDLLGNIFSKFCIGK